MGQSDTDKYIVSESFNGHNAFYGPLKDIACVSLKTALDSSTLSGVVVIHKSELVFRRELGNGSFGTVYKGLLFGEDVAIKCLKVDNSVERLNRAISGVSEDSNVSVKKGQQKRQPVSAKQLPDVILALEREVAILKSLESPQIVPFFGISLNPAAIVTGYCEKGSLFDIIKSYRERPDSVKEFSWCKRLRIAYHGAKGMEYLHFNPNHPVMHGDLKSPNLLIDEKFNCCVADFNTSRFITSEQMKASLVANNPYWLAPEVYVKNKFSKAFDVYPFGIIMWELMTLMVPFQKGDEVPQVWTVAMSVCLKDERPIIPPNEDLPGGPCPVYDEYCALMKQCWSREEDKRPDYKEILSRICEMCRKVDKQEQGEAGTNAFEPSSGASPSAKITRCPLSSTEEIEEALEGARSDDKPELNYECMKLGSFKKFDSAFRRGSRSSLSPSDASVLQETTEQAEKSTRINSRTSMQNSIEATTTGVPKSPQEKRDPSAEAQRRWTLIKSVLHFIIDQKQFLAKEHDDTVTSRKTMIDCYRFEQKSRRQIAQALVDTIPDLQNEMESMASEDLRKMQGWGFIREMIFSDLGPTVHPAWDVLSGHVLARPKLLSSNTLHSLESAHASKEPKRPDSKWRLIRESFFGDRQPAERAVPESWQKLLELLCPSENGRATTMSESTIKEEYNDRTPKKDNEQITKDQETTQNPALEMIMGSSSIMDKHWDFLSSFISESIGEISPNDSESIEPGRWKSLRKMMVVDSEGPSDKKWSFLKDMTLEAELSDDWNSVTDFVKKWDTAPQGKDWDEFRKLFFENKSIRDSVHWGFLKDLFLVDGDI